MAEDAPPEVQQARSEQTPKSEAAATEVVPASNLPARLADGLPATLPVLISPLGPVFPGMISPVPVTDERSAKTLEMATGFCGFLAVRPQGEPPREPIDPRLLYEVGTVGRVMRELNVPEGQRGVVVMASRRMCVKRFITSDSVLVAEVEYPDDIIRDQLEVAALFQRLRQSFKELASLSPDIPDGVGEVIEHIDEAGRFADFVAANLSKDVESRQGILGTFELDSRLRAALLLVEKELELAKLGARLRDEIRQKIEGRQKEHYLREQLQAIRRELGEEVDQRELDGQTFEEKIAAAGLPAEAEKRARQELKRLQLLPPEAPEHHVIRNYLDWIVELPWSRLSEVSVDVRRARQILDEDHHGLQEVKDRIVEFLAVRKLKPEQPGAILCLVGPPGVGKTSLGQSVARATDRRFYRVSLGGLRDEAEIKGHRRTYVGAMPGKIIQALRRVGTRNPVFMLDEIDKLSSDWRGDPASALLEVLDPAQNRAFEDHYLDLPFDLSQVLFIATANMASQVPAPLLDRMEVISLSGYIPEEKLAIATKYLLPRQLEAHGLSGKLLRIPKRTLAAIIERYTREAGVRELERTIGRICRKVAARAAALPKGRRPRPVALAEKDLQEYLGPRRHFTELVRRVRRPGVVVGLAWTQAGGEILFVEVTAMPGSGRLQLTGKLGEVMSESAHIAHSLVRAGAARYGIPERMLKEQDLHLHVPAGAVPKDGPSAGVALTCALLSLLWGGKGKVARARVAMTGEITLRGSVLPVGGIREKLIAARRAGVRTVVLPKANQMDVEEIPPHLLGPLKVVFVEELDAALPEVLGVTPAG
jgi:ATP-dependent Lon protease